MKSVALFLSLVLWCPFSKGGPMSCNEALDFAFIKNFGTPENLDELTVVLQGIPVAKFKVLAPQVIRDYLAQSFGVAYLEADEADMSRLEALFEKLTTREPNEV